MSVTLDSSSDSVCPGDIVYVVFSCATDTGKLTWNIYIDGHNDVFYDSSMSEHKEQSVSIFNFNLTSSIGNHLVSTATAYNVDIDHNDIMQ